MGIRSMNRVIIRNTAGSNPVAGAELIFLDDLRDVPRGYAITDDINLVLVEMAKGTVRGISLDHDLGENVPTGYDLVKKMIEEDVWPTEFVYLHSANPVGVENMLQTLRRYAPDGLKISVVDYKHMEK